MQSFGNYKNLVEIGSGGMATVYRATAPNGNLVALKVLALHLAADPTARLRFEQESNLGLAHPNIARVLESGVKDGAPFIVMEYVVGESLDHRLTNKGPLTIQELAPILRDAAQALDYAHARGVIHRDVKPSNILIRTSGQALLADFGVAKSASLTAYTATAARVGSVFYMSPEQADGALEITAASDIYSLGVTAYYALTGHHPFEGDNEIAIARMHLDNKPRPPSEMNPAVPKAVSAVIMQALEKDPARRPASAGAFARRFEQAANPAKTAGAPIRRARWAVLIAALCLMPILVLAASRLLPAQYSAADAAPTETEVTASATPEATAHLVAPITATASAVSTRVPLSITATATATPSATPTASPTATGTPKPTPTARRPRSTPVPTRRPIATPTRPRPTATRRPTATATDQTPVPTTPTVTPEPSDTVTVEPPTATEPPATVEPTPIPPTSTRIPPTSVPPPTAVPPTDEPPPTSAPTQETP
jgi:hypothetical protein